MAKKDVGAAVVCCVGAIVGAGFASGREIVSFFSGYGMLSWVGVALAAAVMGLLAYGIMVLADKTKAASLRMLCDARMGKAGIIGSAAFFLLLMVTGGSMLSAAGELVALVWPLHYGYETGLLLTLLTGLAFMRRDLKPLLHLGRALLPLMALAFALCGFVKGDAVEAAGNAVVIPKALSYGAMNMALCAPLLCEISHGGNGKARRRIAIYVGLMLFVLLCLGNGVMLRHGEMRGEPLPVIKLLRQYGLFGFYLSAALMYLAVFSTFFTCARGLHTMLAPPMRKAAAMALTAFSLLIIALAGFTRLVDTAYPILGYLCAGLMLAWWLPRKRYGKG